jgi:hypothetical protein
MSTRHIVNSAYYTLEKNVVKRRLVRLNNTRCHAIHGSKLEPVPNPSIFGKDLSVSPVFGE